MSSYGRTPSRIPPLSIPPTQNTAPVFEYNCLYTHDLKRKQKRWQDGFLRYHTFNRRVMVFDVPRNFIGDTYWNGDATVQEGDELQLEKAAALVQVAEKVGETQTDLSEVKKSKAKTPIISSPHASRNYESQRTHVRTDSPVAPSRHVNKHRPLSALLGAPRGIIGKAVLPTRSPYEQKHAVAEPEGWASSRPHKRQRMNDTPGQRTPSELGNHGLINEFDAGRNVKDSNDKSNPKSQRDRPRPRVSQIVDLVSDDHDETDFPTPLRSSNGQLQSSLPGLQSSPLAQLDRGHIDLDAKNYRNTNRDAERPEDSTRIRDGPARPAQQHREQAAQIDQRKTSKQNASKAAMPPAKRVPPDRGVEKIAPPTLRIAAGAPKRKLLVSQVQFTDPGIQHDTVHRGAVAEHSKKQSDHESPPLEDARVAGQAIGRRPTPPKTLNSRSPTPQLEVISDDEQEARPGINAPPEAAVPTHHTNHNTIRSANPAGQVAPPLRMKPPPRPQPANHPQQEELLADTPPVPVSEAPERNPSPTAPPRAIPQTGCNAWSREAFDLFTWRPPGWDEEKWCAADAGGQKTNA